jgi:multidrug efflux pump
LQAWLVGATVTQFREQDQLIDVVWRAGHGNGLPDLRSLERLPDLDLISASGRHIPLAQVARLVPVLEDGLIWRRDRLPTITVRADLVGSIQAPVASAQIAAQLKSIEAALPAGFRIELGGATEESAKGENSIMAVMPLMVLGVITLLMVQLQSMSRTAMVLLTAPLGLIGVTLALLMFQAPFGFVANLGVIALMGMILRNSVILVDQIEQDEQAGKSRWDAIVGSTVRRFRPIVLTAAAAILAMIPLTRQVFWGPMAMAIMGGLVVATALTCLFLPALYAAWYRVKEEAA